jgi:uncharacterized protein (TIGR04222 family)
MTGPEFLQLYLVLMAGAIIAALVVRHNLRGPDDDRSQPQLDPYQTAFLAGGFQAGGEAAVVALTSRGLLQLDPTGRFLGVWGATSWLHPVEQAVFTRVLAGAQTAPGVPARQQSVSASNLVQAARPALAQVRAQLQPQGLVMPPGQVASVRTIRTLIVLLPLVIGLVRLAFGVAGGRPVGYLVTLLVITAVVVLLFVRGPRERTRRGDHVLRRLRRANGALRHSASAAGGWSPGRTWRWRSASSGPPS